MKLVKYTVYSIQMYIVIGCNWTSHLHSCRVIFLLCKHPVNRASPRKKSIHRNSKSLREMKLTPEMAPETACAPSLPLRHCGSLKKIEDGPSPSFPQAEASFPGGPEVSVEEWPQRWRSGGRCGRWMSYPAATSKQMLNIRA